MQFGHFFAPMLLEEIEHPFDSKEYIYELKFDGVRATIHVGPNLFKIYGRRGTDLTTFYPELKEIQKAITKDVIFDGEIVLFQKGVPSFSKLQERSHTKDKAKIEYFKENYPVCFVAFDCLYHDGKDLTIKSLLERKKVLSQFLDSDYFVKVSFVEQEGKKLFRQVKKNNLEGIIAKKKNSRYEVGVRTNSWLKIKNLKKEHFFIGGYIEKKENAVISLLLGEYKNNNFYFVGKVTMGKKQSMYQKLKNEKNIKESPFCNSIEKDCIYLKPTLQCEVWYLERTTENKLRQPVFKKQYIV